MAKVQLHPKRPEQICWGCDKYCPANDLRCGNGTIRTPHPCELFGDDWPEWERETSESQPEISSTGNQSQQQSRAQ
ncbi:MAG TPA: DUF3079 domain-containing protein [Terriglobales bacterium]|jgi:hypothetical protein|nr:DUF3079 domain-containing protein [Terriglobales bacterium]